jgi:ubiquinol-cytochrome c reductase cytochrome c subunit
MLSYLRTSLLAAAALGLLASASFAAETSSAAERGKALYVKNGCYQCHGYQGQGYPGPNAFAGPALAPHPLPIALIVRQLRAPRGTMPPYSANVVSDQQAGDIRAYLATIANGKSAANIPVLAAVDAGGARVPANVAHGQDVFSENCSRCHGASGTEGASGPSLANEKARKDLAATVAFIKNPLAPMPKLYPAPLSDQDVADVAAYIASL